MLIEAMADAGVREGLPRVYAYEMAAQSVLGSALMVLSSGTHPAALKDAVCSPGGTTIEAVEELERKGFRAAIMDAMKVCAEKSREMSK
jgi:pyrroline-5-carboxylate reductase